MNKFKPDESSDSEDNEFICVNPFTFVEYKMVEPEKHMPVIKKENSSY